MEIEPNKTRTDGRASVPNSGRKRNLLEIATRGNEEELTGDRDTWEGRGTYWRSRHVGMKSNLLEIATRGNEEELTGDRDTWE